jgi:hypothetical protein
MTKTAEVFRENDRVNNPTFGIGTIKEAGSQYTTILFDDHGSKKFLTQLVQLERSDAPPREKPVRTAKAAVPKTAT